MRKGEIRMILQLPWNQRGRHLAKLRHLAQVVLSLWGDWSVWGNGFGTSSLHIRGKGTDLMTERMMIRLPVRDRDKERDHLRNLRVGRSREIMLGTGCPR